MTRLENDKEKHGFYCGKEHPLFGLSGAEISWETLQKYPVSTRAYLQQTDLPGIQNKAYVSNMEAQALLISSGQFMGYLPKHYAQTWLDTDDMRAIDHLNLEHESPFYLAMRASSSMQNIVKVFVQDINDILKDRPQLT